MIKITIERTTKQDFTEVQNFVAEEKPTDIKKKSVYNDSEEVQFHRTYQPREVVKQREVKEVLVVQEIAEDADFDIKAVIKAINKL